MSAKNHITLLLLLVYGKIFIGSVASPKTQDLLAGDPLCLMEQNVILPFSKLTQPPDEKRRSLLFWSPEINSSLPEDTFSDFTGYAVSNSAITFHTSFHKSYILFRRLRI